MERAARKCPITTGSGRHITDTAGAEREGFEPSEQVSPLNSLAVSPIRPLSHLSGNYSKSFQHAVQHAAQHAVQDAVQHQMSAAMNNYSPRVNPPFTFPYPAVQPGCR